MAIRLRHDAAAVALPSVSEGSRKYGQQMVLQEQQRKYQAQQAGFDRLFQLGRDQMQNQNQFIRDVRQQTFIDRRDKAQQGIADRDQRKRDFDAARSRIDTHAKDMLANGEIKDPATRQKIQNLIAGKTIVMGSGFDETARQNYLDQYNAELAKILSEVPPLPTPDQEFQQGVATDPETGVRYRKNPKGGWDEILPSKQQQMEQEQQKKAAQAPKPPTSASEAFNDDKTRDRYATQADAYLTGGDPTALPKIKNPDGTDSDKTMTPQQYHAERNKLAEELWGIDHPQPAPKGYGTSSAAYYNVPDPGTPATPGIAPDSRLADQARSLGMDLNAPAQVPVNPVPSGLAPDSRLADQARALGVDTNAPAPVPRGAPPMPAPAAKPPTDGQPLPLPLASGGTVQPGPAQPGAQKPAQAATPDFTSLAARADDEVDRMVLGKLQGIYSTAKPEVQTAISVMVSPGSTKQAKAQAALYLRESGIDLQKLVPQTATDRLNQYQDNLHTTMR